MGANYGAVQASAAAHAGTPFGSIVNGIVQDFAHPPSTEGTWASGALGQPTGQPAGASSPAAGGVPSPLATAAASSAGVKRSLLG